MEVSPEILAINAKTNNRIMLILMISPIAFVIAMAFVLFVLSNKLG
jgi:hypothetical protein